LRNAGLSITQAALAAGLSWLIGVFAPLRTSLGRLGEGRAAREVYMSLPVLDFSRLVLQTAPERLAVERSAAWSGMTSAIPSASG